MTKTTGVLALMVIGLAAGVRDARAQGAPQPQPEWLASLSVGGQMQSRTIGTAAAFALYNEVATVTASQTVGAGILGDAGVDRRVWQNVFLGVGVWAFHSSGSDAPFTASIPDPVRFRNPKIVSGTATDLSQTDLAINIRILYTRPIGDKADFAVFIGPSIIRVKQDFASVTVATGTQNATASSGSESKTTAKGGNAGVDLSYHLNDRYGVGVFVRYAGGEVDLVSSPKMKVGGLQVGGGLRARW